MKTGPVLAAALAGLIGTLATAHADDDAHPSVVARHAHMQLYAHNIGVLGGMAQGQIEYDAERAQTAANNLVAVSSIDETSYWVEGTAEGTNALPAIWENMDDFMAKQDMMSAAAVSMAAAAGTDLASLQGAMADLGGACSACHRAYRQRN